MNRKIKIVCLIILLSMLSGCISMRSPVGAKDFKMLSATQRQARLAKLNFWRIKGAFSIKQGKKVEIAHYLWNQFGQKNYRIHITSAMDLYSVSMFGRYGSVTLWKDGTHAITSKTAEGVMRKAMGWYLPVSQLYYWIKGMPAPKKEGAYEAKYDKFGHLVMLTQKGWLVKLSAYKPFGGVDVPQVLRLQRPDISAKIVIKKWATSMHAFKMPKVMR